LSLAELVLALPPALSPIELDLLYENSKTVLLTSMTAKQVNINTQAHTQLTGSLIAATDTGDKDGNDNGQLNLTRIVFVVGVIKADTVEFG
jgi:hypothetical protein